MCLKRKAKNNGVGKVECLTRRVGFCCLKDTKIWEDQKRHKIQKRQRYASGSSDERFLLNEKISQNKFLGLLIHFPPFMIFMVMHIVNLPLLNSFLEMLYSTWSKLMNFCLRKSWIFPWSLNSNEEADFQILQRRRFWWCDHALKWREGYWTSAKM